MFYLPCPWCGSICSLNIVEVGSYLRAFRCSACDVVGPKGEGKNGAYDKWNDRRRLFPDLQIEVFEPEKPRSVLQVLRDKLNESHPPGTKCYFWVGKKQGPGTEGVLKSWVIAKYHVVALVQGIGVPIHQSQLEFEQPRLF